MKKTTITITCPKVSDTWQLPVSVDMPASFDEWVSHLGKDQIALNLERFTIIRGQDLGRRLKAGSKNTPPASDATIVKAVQAFKLGARITVTHVTPEAAKSALKTLKLEDLNATIAELQRAAAEMAKAEAAKGEEKVEEKTEE